MKEKVTFKSFFSTIWRGIVKTLQWILETVGLRGESKYTKVLRGIVGACLAIWLVLGIVGLVYSIFESRIEALIVRNFSGEGYYDDRELSPNVYLQMNLYDQDYGRVYNYDSKEVTLKKVDWVVVPDGNDSLAVYCKGGRRGYVNRFTGKVTIPAQYEKAWIFSEGLAAVQKDGRVMFIDHNGETVLEGEWNSCYGHDFLFKNGLCTAWNGKKQKFGVIDKTGEWRIEPIYDHIKRINGVWAVGIGGRYGMLDAGLNEVLPVVYSDIVFEDRFVKAQPYLEPTRAYTYTGELINDCVYDGITTTLSSCYKYSVKVAEYDYRYGLLDRYGRKITEPIYTSIEEIEQDIFFCQPDGVLINGNI